MIVLATVLTAFGYAAVGSFEVYIKLRFPECRNCGWITKKDGRCRGCNAKRKYKWQ